MATKKKAAPKVVEAEEPVVVELEAQPLEDWATQAIGIAKIYRAGAYPNNVKSALDEVVIRLRVLISECGVK